MVVSGVDGYNTVCILDVQLDQLGAFTEHLNDTHRILHLGVAQGTYRSGEIPSLTLWSDGYERSQIKRHLLGWCGFGTRPRGLVWTNGVSWGEIGPSNLPAANSAEMRSSTTGLLYSS